MTDDTSTPVFTVELDGCEIPVFAAGASSPMDAANRVTGRAFDALTRAYGSTSLIDPDLMGAKRGKSGEPSSPLVSKQTAEYPAHSVGQE